MRTYSPYIWLYLISHFHSNRLSYLLWFSVGLILSLHQANQPVQAEIASSEQPVTDSAITTEESQHPRPITTAPTSEPLPSTPAFSVTQQQLDQFTRQTTQTAGEAINGKLSGLDPAIATPLPEGNSRYTPSVPLTREPEFSKTTLPISAAIAAATNAWAEAVLAIQQPEIAQTSNPVAEDAIEPVGETDDLTVSDSSEPLQTYQPLLEFQAVSIFQDGGFSGRLRATGLYAISEQVLFGATVDLTTGDSLVDSENEGLSLNELYVSAAPFRTLPNLRFVGGLIDLTSYFDRNSFAKDGATHFFNPVFQTNPALSSAGITSRPGLLFNWSATDNLELKAAAFSSTRNLGDFAIDGFATELGFRTGNLIIRGTYASARDAGEDNGFSEIFQLERSDGSFGLLDDDRETAIGVNAEYFIESINLGFFGRYGRYTNQDLDSSGSTASVGLNALDVFRDRDRLGLAYGWQLSNSDLRTGATPDVLELFYDTPIIDGVRAGVSLQSRDEFSDTFFGFRLRANW